MVTQFKPKEGGDGRYYCPNRDIAYLFPYLWRWGLGDVDRGVWDNMIKHWGLTEADLAAGVQCVNDAMQNALKHEKFPDALQEAGFYDCKAEVQMMLLSVIGAKAASCWHRGMGETSSTENEIASHQATLNELETIATETVSTLAGRMYEQAEKGTCSNKEGETNCSGSKSSSSKACGNETEGGSQNSSGG